MQKNEDKFKSRGFELSSVERDFQVNDFELLVLI